MNPLGMRSAASLEEASALLKEYGDDAAVCAGGTELVLLLKLGLASPTLLVRLDRLGLDRVEQTGGLVRLGATVTHLGASRSGIVQSELPLMSRTLSGIANPRVRAAGTLGGNVCFAEPHSDLGTLLVLYGATVVLTSCSGERRVAASDFFTGTLTTARLDDEVLSAIEVPRLGSRVSEGYARFVVGERPNVVVACTIHVDPSSGVVAGARLVVGCTGPRPTRIARAEEVLCGAAIDRPHLDAAVSDAAAACAAECEADDEDEMSAWHKRRVVRALARRAVSEAARRALAALEEGGARG